MINQCSCVFCYTIMTNLICLTILICACAIAKSVNKALNTKRSINQTSNETIGGVSTNRLLDVWETFLSFSRYFLSNTVSQNIDNCSVALSLLFSIYCVINTQSLNKLHAWAQM